MTRDIDQISSATWNRLLDCLAYAMDHPRGDGNTILNLGFGLLQVGRIAGAGSGSGADDYAGPFKVRRQGQDVELQDGGGDGEVAGVITAGSHRWEIARQRYELLAGIVYAEVVYDPETKEFTAGVYLEEAIPESDNPRRWICRIAEITPQGDGYVINQIWKRGDIEVLGRWLS